MHGLRSRHLSSLPAAPRQLREGRPRPRPARSRPRPEGRRARPSAVGRPRPGRPASPVAVLPVVVLRVAELRGPGLARSTVVRDRGRCRRRREAGRIDQVGPRLDGCSRHLQPGGGTGLRGREGASTVRTAPVRRLARSLRRARVVVSMVVPPCLLSRLGVVVLPARDRSRPRTVRWGPRLATGLGEAPVTCEPGRAGPARLPRWRPARRRARPERRRPDGTSSAARPRGGRGA